MIARIIIILFLLGDSFEGVGQSPDEYVCSIPSVKEMWRFNKLTSKKSTYMLRVLNKLSLCHISRHLEHEKKILNLICTINDKHASSLYRASDFAYTQMCRKTHLENDQLLINGSSQFQNINEVIDRMDKLLEGSNLDLDSGASAVKGRNSQVVQNLMLLRKELKRSEVIQVYLISRTEYWTRLIKRYPIIIKECKRMDVNADLYGAIVENRKNIFLSHSKFEKNFINQINQCSKDQLADKPIPAISNSAPNLKLEELLNKQGVELNKALDMTETLAVISGDRSIEECAHDLDSLSAEKMGTKKRGGMENDFDNDSIINLGTKDNNLRAKRFWDRITFTFQLSPNNYKDYLPTAIGLNGRFNYQGTKKLAVGLIVSRNVICNKKQTIDNLNNAGFMPWRIGGALSYELLPRLGVVGLYESSRLFRTASLESTSSFITGNTKQVNDVLLGIKMNQRSNKYFRTNIELLFRCDFKSEISAQNIIIRMGFDLNSKHYNYN